MLRRPPTPLVMTALFALMSTLGCVGGGGGGDGPAADGGAEADQHLTSDGGPPPDGAPPLGDAQLDRGPPVDVGPDADIGPGADIGPDADIEPDADLEPDADIEPDAELCTPDCDDRACGPDGCGGVCGACADGAACDADGRCVEPPAACGNGTCDADEDCANCLEDCPCGPDQRCDRGVCALDCPDDCGPLWQASCTVDGFGYRLCTPDPERPGCGVASRRISCGDGRTCGAGEGDAACGGRCARPEVILLVDRSSSMEGERWQFTRSALVDMAGARAPFVRLGLRMFPGELDGCAAGPIAAPAFDAIDPFDAMPAPAQVAQTPIASALAGVGDAFGDPDEGESVILVTDGDETCAGEFDAVETAATLRLRGVRTFVIGIGREANGDLLAAIAEAGGTAALGPGPYWAVQDGPALRAALDAIYALLEVGRPEQCNALDDDCDGAVDEALIPRPAERRDGVCADAVQRCEGEWVEPDYAAIAGYEADEASCDGRDNDCDGATDEALDPPPAEQQAGVCDGADQICAGRWREPDYASIDGYEAPEARCDGLDNDCDGAIDEALDPPPAQSQRGVCRGAEQICDGAWREPDYAALPGYEQPEVTCDGLDNDCDGAVDERLDPPDALRQDGVCRGAVQICAGRWIEPDYADLARYESPETTCEGLDNDCDGRIDEDAECPVVCGRDEAGPPCNRCPEGTFVPAGWVCIPAGGAVEEPFLIQATEVTRAQWTALIAVDHEANEDCAQAEGARALECPVARVNWWEAAAFANAATAASPAPLTPCYTLRNCQGEPGRAMECDIEVPFDPACTGYRLPTAAEWTHAIRAGTRTTYWSGNAEADLARVDWYETNAMDRPHRVGQRPANPWGLHDVHGNLREWSGSWAALNFSRFLMGGSWDDSADFCDAEQSFTFRPDSRSRNVGLRLARSAPSGGCGDGICDPDAGERCDTCPLDCGGC